MKQMLYEKIPNQARIKFLFFQMGLPINKISSRMDVPVKEIREILNKEVKENEKSK